MEILGFSRWSVLKLKMFLHITPCGFADRLPNNVSEEFSS
jgi:hypothetical protein